MKSEKGQYLKLGITIFVSLAATVTFFFALFRSQEIKAFLSIILSALQPVFIGIVLAYLLCPIAKFLERQICRVSVLSCVARLLSALLTLVLAFGVLGLFCAMIIPQLAESVGSLVNDLPGLLQAQFDRLSSYMESDNEAATSIIQMVESAETYLFMAIASLAELLLPTGLASMIALGVGGQDASLIGKIAILMAVFCAVAMIASAVSTAITAKLSVGFAAQIREQIFSRVQNFSAAEMDRFGPASLVTRSTSDVASVQSFLSALLRMGISAPLMAVAGLALSAATGGSVSVVLTVAIPVLLIALAIIAILMLRYSAILRTKVDGLNHLFLEALEGVRVIRAFNKQAYEKERFAKANDEYVKIATRSGRFSGLLMPVVNLIFGITTAAMMAIGAVMVYQGEIEVGALIGNTQYVSMILSAVIMLSVVVVMYPNAAACARRINEVLQTETSIQNPEQPAEVPVLKDISFVSRPGEFTAIIGGTGCGKSSIVKLIPRLYDTMFGEVLVDGVNVKKYDLRTLRDKIGYVQQKNILFSGSISDNLSFCKENASMEEQHHAAEIASAAEFIEKRPDGYGSQIAQGGTNVSGGQKQRLAIARALIKKPEIYLFDDSFSALDVKTDRELRTKLRKETKNSTVIIVAQRVSSIIDADRILVLDKGQIVGQGTHQELLQSCPLYREIAELQMGKEALGA